MRLIGEIEGEKEAFTFYTFLLQEGIVAKYNRTSEEARLVFEIWVEKEEEIEIAKHWFTEFKKNPEDARFKQNQHPIDSEGTFAKNTQVSKAKNYVSRKLVHTRFRPFYTQVIIALCVIIYFWSNFQYSQLEKQKSAARFYNFTPIFLALAYDMPKSFPLLVQFFQNHPVDTQEDLRKLPPMEEKQLQQIEAMPVWKGLYEIALKWPSSRQDLKSPLFVKISEGQLWRLLSPVFLHGGFLHILFNMLWLYMLGSQIEARIKSWQYLLLTVLIGVISNTCQYLVSGPLFIGYSGIICGLAGFIWMRQKRAPWEGYPLHRSALVFLAIFIVGMFALQVVSFVLIRYNIANFPLNIANTAHLSGAISGLVLGRIPFFSKGNL